MHAIPRRCAHCDRYCDGCSLSTAKEDPLDAARGIMTGALLGVAAWGLFVGLLIAMHYEGLL